MKVPVLSFPCLRTINGATVNVLDRCLPSFPAISLLSLSAMHGSRFGEYLRQTTDCWAYSPVRRLREFSQFTQPPIDKVGQGVGAARDWLRITVLVCFPLPSMTDVVVGGGGPFLRLHSNSFESGNLHSIKDVRIMLRASGWSKSRFSQ